MDLNGLWELIEPQIGGIVSWIVGGGLTGVLTVLVTRFFTNKTIKKLDQASMVSQITSGVGTRLAGSSIKVDLKAVTEKQMKAIGAQIADGQEELLKKLNEVLVSNSQVLECISMSAKISTEKRDKMTQTLAHIRETTRPIEAKEDIILELREEAPQDDIVANAPQAEPKQKKFVNFN